MTDHHDDANPETAAAAGAHPPFERLSDAVDGASTLPAAEREGIERHLAACAACRADADALRRVLALAQSAPRAVEPPPEVWAGVRARLAPRKPAARVLYFTRHLTWRRATALAAAVLAVASVGLLAGAAGVTSGSGAAIPDNALFRAVRDSRPFRAVRTIARATRPPADARLAAAPQGPLDEDAAAVNDFLDTLRAALGDSVARGTVCGFERGEAHVRCVRDVPSEARGAQLRRDVAELLRLPHDPEPLARGVPVPVPSVAVMRQTAALDRAATELASTVSARQDALPPAARASLSRSLGVVDTAVAEARAALLRDPADVAMADALAAAQERRVELLRQAARLLSED